MPMRCSAPHHHDKPYSQLRRSNRESETGTMPMRRSAPHHHDKPYFRLRRSNWNLIGQVVMKKNVFLSMVISIAVWGETFTHGSVRGWGWNSLALLDLDPWPAAKIQLWLAQTKNNVWSIESVQSDGIMDIKICWFLEIYFVIWKIFFIFPAQMD